jgi:hypothetical protein
MLLLMRLSMLLLQMMVNHAAAGIDTALARHPCRAIVPKKGLLTAKLRLIPLIVVTDVLRASFDIDLRGRLPPRYG